ncbi:hypothetical protein ACJX0J_020978, partial [Zea mays]
MSFFMLYLQPLLKIYLLISMIWDLFKNLEVLEEEEDGIKREDSYRYISHIGLPKVRNTRIAMKWENFENLSTTTRMQCFKRLYGWIVANPNAAFVSNNVMSKASAMLKAKAVACSDVHTKTTCFFRRVAKIGLDTITTTLVPNVGY